LKSASSQLIAWRLEVFLLINDTMVDSTQTALAVLQDLLYQNKCSRNYVIPIYYNLKEAKRLENALLRLGVIYEKMGGV
jgi:hypothetical protein